MQRDLLVAQIKFVLQEFFDDILKDLKGTSHEIRLKLLIDLLDGSRALNFLEKKHMLSKTKLLHHLTILIELDHIKRSERGYYTLTNKGLTFLESIVKNYRSSLRRIRKKKIASKRVINFVSSAPVFQPGWNAFISSVAGVLIALGVGHDHYWIGGRTGYCFLISVSKDDTSVLGGSLLGRKTWKTIYQGTESLGWKLKEWRRLRIHPEKWVLQTDENEKAMEMFNAIKRIIDYKDTPVILWGIRIPTFGIVNGYIGDSFLVSTRIHRIVGQNYVPIRYDDLRSPQDLKFIYFDEEIEIIDENLEDMHSLQRAINFSKKNDLGLNNIISGFEAFEVWANILLNGDKDQLNAFGNSFLGRKYCDQRAISTEYIERLARKYGGYQHSEALTQASVHYRKVKLKFEEFVLLFPHYNLKKDHFDSLSREGGARILLEALEHEKNAVYYLEKSLKQWQN